MDENEAVQDENEEQVPFVKKKRFPGLGILFAMIACAFFALGSVFVKLISDIGGVSLAISRFSVQFLLLLPLLTYRKNEVDVLGPVGLRRFLYMRGIFGALCVPLLYLSVKRMDVGDAITIAYTSTVMVPIFARFILKENLTILEIVLGFVSVLGVILIARPSFLFHAGSYKPVDGLGVMLGLLGAVCQALSMITIRKLGKTHVILNIAYFSICGSIMCFLILPISEKIIYPCFGDLLYISSLGILGIIGQCFLTLALRCERAATVGVARSIQVIFAYILQVSVIFPCKLPFLWYIIINRLLSDPPYF